MSTHETAPSIGLQPTGQVVRIPSSLGQMGLSIVLTHSFLSGTVPRMARKRRLEFAGAVYHVLNRGDRREDIFEDDQACSRSPQE